MSLAGMMKRLGAVLCLAMAAALTCAATAFAAEVTVSDAQTILTESDAAKGAEINVLYLAGEAGETVYLNVMDDGNTLARWKAHVLGENGQAGEDVVDSFGIVPDAPIDEAKLKDGSYVVEVWTQRGGDKLYSGTVYGVWARLQGSGSSDGNSASTLLIGTRTASDAGGYSFVAPTVVYKGSQPYKLAGSTPEMDGGAAYYDYEPYDAASTVDGIVNFIDASGAVLKTETIPGIPADGTATYDVPATITANGKRYRTMSAFDTLTASNPDRVSFTVLCSYVGGAPYVAHIQMVDEAGTVLALDTLNVDGIYSYTAPSAIYQTEDVDGEERAVTYELQDGAVVQFDATADMPDVVDGARTVTFHYARQAPDAGEVQVTYYQLDGQENPDVADRLLATQSVTVTKDDPTAEPAESVKFNGITYKLAGNASDYRYTYGSGKIPVINVYYVPENYQNPVPYTVTVSYVDIATGRVVDSATHDSTADPATISLDSPESFAKGGTNYVRLRGQDTAIEHNFYSNAKDYTVYYRDRDNDAYADTVITRTRVVYQGTTGTAGTTTTTTATTTTNAAAGTTGATDATGTPGENAAGARSDASMNPTTPYSTIGGDGNGTTVTPNGSDTNTERIGDDETALASGNDDAEKKSDGGGSPLVSLGIVVLVAAVLAIGAIWFVMSRRRNERY